MSGKLSLGIIRPKLSLTASSISRRYSFIPRGAIGIHPRAQERALRQRSLRPRSIHRIDSFPLCLLARLFAHHVSLFFLSLL
jgi:hypothetical protein